MDMKTSRKATQGTVNRHIALRQFASDVRRCLPEVDVRDRTAQNAPRPFTSYHHTGQAA